MRVDELKLWIASLSTRNFIKYRGTIAIVINLYYVDTWEGPDGVRLTEVSLLLKIGDSCIDGFITVSDHNEF